MIGGDALPLFAAGWRITARCAGGKREGMKTKRECHYTRELDLETLVWTRGPNMPGDENDGQRDPCLGELVLERQTTHAGEAHVEHEATGQVATRGPHELWRRREQAHLESDGPEQAVERLPHGRIVVHDEDDCLLLGQGFHRHSGASPGSQSADSN